MVAGDLVVAGSLFANMVLDTALYDYDASGVVSDEWVFDGSKPEVGNLEIIDTPNGLERDSTGRLYVIGTYSPLSGPQIGSNASYLAAVSGRGAWLSVAVRGTAPRGQTRACHGPAHALLGRSSEPHTTQRRMRFEQTTQIDQAELQ